jgi:hypothetical protein
MHVEKCCLYGQKNNASYLTEKRKNVINVKQVAFMKTGLQRVFLENWENLKTASFLENRLCLRFYVFDFSSSPKRNMREMVLCNWRTRKN